MVEVEGRPKPELGKSSERLGSDGVVCFGEEEEEEEYAGGAASQ